MVHLLASTFFSLTALGALGVSAFSLAEEREKIGRALGLTAQATVRMPVMARRVRPTAAMAARSVPLRSREAA